MKKCMIVLASLASSYLVSAQTDIPKTYTKPVLMHYMPWFESPDFDGQWGYHWSFYSADPSVVVDEETGERDIASWFNPIIGPYSSKDPAVLKYQLLLMKYAGVDGVIVDWYGTAGTNVDIQKLLDGANPIINYSKSAGMDFAVMLEDRFAAGPEDVKTNLTYCKNNYFNRSNYHRVDGQPLLPVFGPNMIFDPEQWKTILPSAGEEVVFLQYQGNAASAGIYSDGEYAWINATGNTGNHLSNLTGFYAGAGNGTLMGVAYPGFQDYYAEGGVEASYPTIDHNGTGTLDATLGLLDDYNKKIDLLQLATWNDYGEGTMFEPTLEHGYDFLLTLQEFLGVDYGQDEFDEIHRLYTLMKKYRIYSEVSAQLDMAYDAFANNDPESAKTIMDTLVITDVLADIDTTYQIVNRWTSAYVWQNNDSLAYRGSVYDSTYWWRLHTVSGDTVLMENVGSGGYAYIDPTQNYVMASPDVTDQDAAKWIIVQSKTGYNFIENVAYPDWFMHTQNKKYHIEFGAIESSDWESAQWTLVPYTTFVGVEEQQLMDMHLSVDIYPNPASHYVTVNADDRMLSVDILDISGRLLRQDAVQYKYTAVLNVSDLPAGPLMLRVAMADGTYRLQKLIKE